MQDGGATGQKQRQQDLNAAYARVFGSADGQKVLADLRSRSIEVDGSQHSDGPLRALEGERKVVRDIERRVKQGREGK